VIAGKTMPTAILDFSYLTGTRRVDLENALGGYTVLLTFELLYEISTNSQGIDPSKYLQRLKVLNLVHSRSLHNLVREEVKISHRAHDILHPQSKQFIDALKSGQIPASADDVRNFFESSEPQELKEALDQLWGDNFDGIFAGLRMPDPQAEAKKYIELFSSPGAPSLGDMIAKRYGVKHTPQPGWLIYDWQRLRNFLAFRYRLRGNRSLNLPDKTIANDLADITYVAIASRVDAIATRDRATVIPLAEVFYQPQPKIIQ
jgi:hypothetical protein